MKKKQKLLVIASLALAGMLMTACDNEGGSTSQTSFVPVTVDGEVYQINVKDTDKLLPYVAVDQTIDLDDYYEVEMMDGQKISTYSIENLNKDLVVDGHKITAKKVGSYEIRLAVNDKWTYVTIDCKTAANLELIEFFDKMNETGGQNYTLDMGTYNAKTKRFYYEDYTIIHNQNYVAAFNRNNIGETDDNGDPSSFILANLSDGHGYMGGFNEQGLPEFENGKINIGNYYITMPLTLDGASFESRFNEITGEETLVGNKAQAALFLNHGMSNFVENYGYDYNSIYVLDFTDEDKDGQKDTIYFKITVDGTNSNGVSFTDSEWCTMRMSNVGTTKYAPLETAITTNSYVPVPLKPVEIGTAFKNITDRKNYTTTMNFYASESDGTQIADDKVNDTSAYYLLMGTKKALKTINTITADGIESSLYVSDSLAMKKAYWNEGSKAYQGDYAIATEEEGETNTKEEIENVTDVFTLDDVLDYTTSRVTQENINLAIWKKRKADEANNTITYTGDIGDDTLADGKTNGFFEELMNQAGLLTTSIKGQTYKLGTYFTFRGAISYKDGTEASYTVSSRYTGVMVNTTTNEVTVKALMNLPFSDITQPYATIEYTITNIGNTTNNFVYGA